MKIVVMLCWGCIAGKNHKFQGFRLKVTLELGYACSWTTALLCSKHRIPRYGQNTVPPLFQNILITLIPNRTSTYHRAEIFGENWIFEPE